MKLGTLRTDKGLVAVAHRDGQLWELPASVRELLSWEASAVEKAVESATVSHPYTPEMLAPAVSDPGKVLCIGRNYAAHAAERGEVPTAKPDVFLRVLRSLNGPFGQVPIPKVSNTLDWEVELAVVIGRGGRYIERDDAMSHVGGYAVFNDFSVRQYQRFTTQWTAGKNFDRTGPLGPFVVTADEVSDPGCVKLYCGLVTGGKEEQVQSSDTSYMLHDIPTLISYISQFTTLDPGDVIATGTPEGVGSGRKPEVFLEVGQVVVSRVEGVGEMRNEIVDDTLIEP